MSSKEEGKVGKNSSKLSGLITFFSKDAHLRLRISLLVISIIPLIYFVLKEDLLGLLVSHVGIYYVFLFNSALAKKRNILRLSMGEMRRAIAIILTIAFISTLFLDLNGSIETTGYTRYFAYGIYGTIISFYFGFRAAEKRKIEALIKKEDATQTLEMRYALGELSETEFDNMKTRLKK